MRILISNIILAFILIACSSSANNSADARKHSKFEIYFSASPCFGKCKVYNINLKNNIMELNAIENTPMLGEFSSEVTAEELNMLWHIVEANSIMSNLKEEAYGQDMTDLPYIEMRIKIDNKEKVIKYRNIVPESIKKIDSFLRSTISELHRWESKK